MATIALPEGTARRALERVICAVDASPAGAEAVREALCVAAVASHLSFVAVDESVTISSLG